MNNLETLSFVSYFLELFSALKLKISFKEYLSDRKTIEQIDKKTDNIFYKIMDFAKNRPENRIIRVDNLIGDELFIPLDDFGEFIRRDSIKNSVFCVDEFASATADVLKRQQNELHWETCGETRVGLSLQPSEFYTMLHVYMYILFDNHRTNGRLVSSSPDEQGLEIVRKKTNNSKKIEPKKRVKEKNSIKNEQNTLKVRDDTNDSCGVEPKRDPKWRKAVLKRDRYTCQICGYDIEKNLEAHHIYSFRDNEAYRTQVDNGITLCKFCHKKYHSEFGRDGANPYELMLFFKKYGIK